MAYAAGILPFAVHEGIIIFLVGKDAQDGLWSDFGGKAEQLDKTDLDTAQREFTEETCGVIVDLETLRARMTAPGNYKKLVSSTQSRHPYYMYLLQVPFDPGSRAAFRRQVKFLRSIRLHKRYVEKADIEWVTWPQLQALKLRTVFQATLVKHKDLLSSLQSSSRSSSCSAGLTRLPETGCICGSL